MTKARLFTEVTMKGFVICCAALSSMEPSFLRWVRRRRHRERRREWTRASTRLCLQAPPWRP